MQATARFLDGWRFEVEARGHKVISDQPRDKSGPNSGSDEGMTPPEFLLASLASCAGYYAAQYLKTRSLSTAGLTIDVTAEKALQPARLASFHIGVNSIPLDERHQAGLMRAVKACLVHNTLTANPTIDIELKAIPLQSGTEPAIGQGLGNPPRTPPLEWRA